MGAWRMHNKKFLRYKRCSKHLFSAWLTPLLALTICRDIGCCDPFCSSWDRQSFFTRRPWAGITAISTWAISSSILSTFYDMANFGDSDLSTRNIIRKAMIDFMTLRNWRTILSVITTWGALRIFLMWIKRRIK